MRLLVLTMLLTCPVLTGVVRAENFSGAVTLELHDGIFAQKEKAEPKPCDLTIDVSCENGKWNSELWAFSSTLSRFWHSGEVTGATGGAGPGGDIDGELRLSIKFSVSREVGHDIGDGDYTLVLKRAAPADQWQGTMLAGTFEGTFRERKVSGSLIGRVRPLPAKIPGFEAVTSGDHPRLLFRKKELPLLREKANTPAGQAILAHMRAKLELPAAPREKSYHAAAYGLLYLLRGDKQDAETAMDITEAALRDDFCTQRYLSSDALMGVALAYDLCFDAWTPEYRAIVSSFIDARVRYIIVSDGNDPRKEASGPAQLDYDMNPASEWQAKVRGAAAFAALAIVHDPSPVPPETEPPQVRTIVALPDVDLGRGLPVNKLEHDVMPQRWLFVGPFTPPDKTAWGPHPPKEPLDFLESAGGHQHLIADIGTRVRAFGMTREFAPLPPRKFGKYIAERSVMDLGGVEAAGALTHFAAPSVGYFYTVIENDKARPVKLLAHVGWRIPRMTLWLSGQEVENGELIQLAPGRHTLLVRVALDQPQSYLACPRMYLLTDDEFKTETDERMAAWQERKKERETRGMQFEKIMRSESIAEHALQRFMQRGLFDCLDDANPALPATLGRSLLPFLIAHRNVKGADFATGTPAERIVDFCLMQTIGERAKSPSEWVAPSIAAIGVESSREFVVNDFEQLWGLRGDKSFGIAATQHAVYALAGLLRATAWKDGVDFPKTYHDPSNTVWAFRNAWKDVDDIAATVNLAALHPKHVYRESLGAACLKIAGLGARWQLHETLEREPAVAVHERIVVPPRNCLSEFLATGGFVTETGQGSTVTFAADYSGMSGAVGVFVIAFKAESAASWTLDFGAKSVVSVGDNGFTVTAPNGARLQGRFSTAQELIHAREFANVIEMRCAADFTLVLTLAKSVMPEATFEGAGKDLKIRIGPEIIAFDAGKIIFSK